MFLPKSFKQIEFCNIFDLSNIIDAVIYSWDEICVRFGDRIYFTVVRTHGKMSHQVLVQEYKENSIHFD